MDIDNLPAYVITINQEKLSQKFKAHIKPTIFKGITDSKNKFAGALKSHFQLWDSLKTLYKSNEYVIIFEDDAYLCRNMTMFDKKGINTFMNEFKGNLLFLGFHPTINKFTRTNCNKIVKGYALDSHAYIIKVKFATFLYNKYYKKKTSFWSKKLLPIGHVDTLFLIYKIYAIYPMLYGQKDEKRYDSIFLNKGITKNNNPYKYITYRIGNVVYTEYLCLTIILFALIIFIITFLLYKKYARSKVN